jgi:hypothetical protein
MPAFWKLGMKFWVRNERELDPIQVQTVVSDFEHNSKGHGKICEESEERYASATNTDKMVWWVNSWDGKSFDSMDKWRDTRTPYTSKSSTEFGRVTVSTSNA